MGINQQIKPKTLERKSNLKLGGCDLIDLASKYGTPLYVIDEQTIRDVCSEYKKAFENYKNIKMTYASKALCNMAISRIIADEGFGFDAVSIGEIYTIYRAGIDMSTITFNGNNKTEREIELALDLKVGLFSVDNFYEAKLLNEIANKKNIDVNILLRITPGIECHTHDYIKTGQIDSKFGFDMSQIDEAVSLVLNQYNHLKLKGLHAHIGSQIFELQSYKDEINILIEELVRINNKFNVALNELNIGGGLGIKYTEEDKPVSIKDFGDVVIKSISEVCQKNQIELPTIYIEPGRSMISTAGVTLYRVGSSKSLNIANNVQKKYIAVDGGMADNPRPAMYNAKYWAEIANDIQNRSLDKVTVAGRYCESGDVLIENILLHEPKPGDVLCVYNTGAYNYSMASNYNRTEKPAMVLVNNSQSDMIVNRESLEDLIALENIPDRLRR